MLCLQFPVDVQDSGSPRKSARATVFVSVSRNLNGPVFFPTDYNVTIPEDKLVDTLVIDLDATEADGVSI